MSNLEDRISAKELGWLKAEGMEFSEKASLKAVLQILEIDCRRKDLAKILEQGLN